MKLMQKLKSAGRGNILAREEWDFSTCPPDELRDCYYYELMRESKVHRDSLLKWRRYQKGSTFDDWLPISSKPSRAGRPPLFGWEFFSFCPEWPAQPYLSIPQDERQRRRKLIPKIVQPADERNGLRVHLLPKLLKNYSDGTPTGKKYVLPPLNLATVKSDDGTHETVAFEIDWRHTDGTLSKLFRLWLKINRPKEVRRWIIKGKGRTSEQIRKDLKALGAWRLLQKMTWQEAALLTSESDPSPNCKSLFDNQSSWIGARHHAEKVLAGLIG
jgi:hypothetical protein